MGELSLAEQVVNLVITVLLRLTCRLDVAQMRRIPTEGPIILISNHTSNIEAAAIKVFLRPRKATGLGKIELWENRITRLIMNAWGVIPLHRGQVDSAALKASLAALADGYLLGMAPEGTRSKTGKLRKAGRGAAMLALRTGVPVYPIAQLGFRDLPHNLLRMKRTRASLHVGRPFLVRDPTGAGHPPEHQGAHIVLRRITDEMMYRIAEMLPPENRGVYSDLESATTEFLEFLA